MRSSDLANLAGVTVRALRHYHQVGVLDEPERGSNGYRSYDVHDLVRVLRIKRLASLGISLDRMSELLDDTEDASSLLDELDLELAGQIDRLTKQREVIAQLRDHKAAPDLPPELARFAGPFSAAFANAGLSPELAKGDRLHSVLLAHLAGEDAMPHLASFYEWLSDPERLPAVTTFAERFGELGPDSTEDDIAAAVEFAVEAFGSVVGEGFVADLAVSVGGSADLLGEYTFDLLNDQQRQALEQFDALSRAKASGNE